ncbi:hypothetical protein [Endozoicomonas sp. Mp262]|uniref:hypothetical protein n=1 Tax=Endozoicomonas sp. Mp262 TaxID=2919499 RepID=UPI0021DA793D
MDVSQKPTGKSRPFLSALALSAIILTPTNLHSATQGSLGKTSSATMTITLIIPPKLETRVAEQIPVTQSPTPTQVSVNSAIPLCISSNGMASYTVTARGHDNSGSFRVKNGNSWESYKVLLWKNPYQAPQQLNSGQPSEALQPLGRNESCERASRLALHMKNKLKNFRGAMNLTISAD